MSQPIRGQGGHLPFLIGPKNRNLVEGIEILLPVKFRWILFSGFREEVENTKVYARRKTDGRTTRYDNSSLEPLALLSLKSIYLCFRRIIIKKWLHVYEQEDQRASYYRSSDYNKYFCFKFDFLANQMAWLPFQLAWKTETWQRTLRFCFLSTFVEICSTLSKEKSKMSQLIRCQDGHFFSDRPKKHKLGRGRWDRAFCQVSLNSI